MPVAPDLPGGAKQGLGKVEPHQAIPPPSLFRSRQDRAATWRAVLLVPGDTVCCYLTASHGW